MMRLQSRNSRSTWAGVALLMAGAVVAWSGLVHAQAPTPAKNVKFAREVAKRLAANLPDVSNSIAKGALQNAVMTAPEKIPHETRERLAWLLEPARST